MRRELPAKPNLEHLKSQAKDLVDAHRRGEPEAFARIRASVPAFANWSDEQIARGPFALHDAQSAIAREYGCASWAELRTKVAGGADSAADSKDPVDRQLQVARIGGQLSPAMEAAMKQVLALRGWRTSRCRSPTRHRTPRRRCYPASSTGRSRCWWTSWPRSRQRQRPPDTPRAPWMWPSPLTLDDSMHGVAPWPRRAYHLVRPSYGAPQRPGLRSAATTTTGPNLGSNLHCRSPLFHCDVR